MYAQKCSPQLCLQQKNLETGQCLTIGNDFYNLYIVYTYNGIYDLKIMLLRTFNDKKMFKIY